MRTYTDNDAELGVVRSLSRIKFFECSFDRGKLFIDDDGELSLNHRKDKNQKDGNLKRSEVSHLGDTIPIYENSHR